MLRAIFFDATETLIYLPSSVGEHYREVARVFGVKLEAAALDRAFRRAWKEAPDRVARAGPQLDDDKGWWRGLVNRVLELTLPADEAAFPADAYFEQLYNRFAEPGVWQMFPEVPEVLAALRERGLRLGVISNFDRRLYPVLRELGLSPYFEKIIISSEVGADKPDPAIFRHALAALGVPANAALHVGDDPKRDGGARALGMQVFEVERPRNSLRNLPAFINEENLRAQTR